MYIYSFSHPHQPLRGSNAPYIPWHKTVEQVKHNSDNFAFLLLVFELKTDKTFICSKKNKNKYLGAFSYIF